MLNDLSLDAYNLKNLINGYKIFNNNYFKLNKEILFIFSIF